MDESRFLSLMTKARRFSSLGERSDYWHGYQRGLRRGFLGALFGTEGDHALWMRLANGGSDEASRERGRGYRDGLTACRADIDDSAPTVPPVDRRRDWGAQSTRIYPRRR
jgi:hypothetical protein